MSFTKDKENNNSQDNSMTTRHQCCFCRRGQEETLPSEAWKRDAADTGKSPRQYAADTPFCLTLHNKDDVKKEEDGGDMEVGLPPPPPPLLHPRPIKITITIPPSSKRLRALQLPIKTQHRGKGHAQTTHKHTHVRMLICSKGKVRVSCQLCSRHGEE